MMKTNSDPGGLGSQLTVAALFAVIGLGVLYLFVTFAEPPERQPRVPFVQNYSEQPLVDALTDGGFEQRVAEIAAAGRREGERAVGRSSGSPGGHRTEELIADSFRAAGLEVLTQELQVVVPVTEFCEILGEDGQPLPGVQLYPFGPSGLTPIALPPEGITARLVATETAQLKYLAGYRPEESIVLTTVDAAQDWLSQAAVGTRALILREDELAKKLQANPDEPGPWRALLEAAKNAELAFPRFVARGPIEEFDGRTVTLRCKVTWQSRPVHNILGVLRGARPRPEALVLTAFSDSASVIPELAPGAEQSLSLAALLEYARALAPYRDELQRDLIFVATAGHAQGLAGVSRLMETIQAFSKGQPDYRTFEDRKRDENRRLQWATRALAVLEEIEQQGLTREKWTSENEEFREWFEENFAVVGGEINLDHREAALAVKLRHLQAGSPVFRVGFDPLQATDEERKDSANTHPLLLAYLEARKLDNRSANLMSLRLWEAAAREEFRSWGYLPRARERFQQIAAYHRQQVKELDDRIAVRAVFAPYQQTLTINLELYSGGWMKKKDLSVLVGVGRPGTVVEPQVTDLANAILEKLPRVNGDPAWKVIQWGARDAEGSLELPNVHSGSYTELESEPWYFCGRLAFTIVNFGPFPLKIGTPEDRLDGLALDVVEEQLPVLGRNFLAMGFGRVPFKTIPAVVPGRLSTFHGTVFGSAGTATLVPTHPMAVNTFVQPIRDDLQRAADALIQLDTRGVQLFPVLAANPYGQYRRQIGYDIGEWSSVNVHAARFDEDGRVLYFQDASPASQSVYKCQLVSGRDIGAATGQAPKPIHVPMFRCSGVALYDQGNPKTLKTFKGVTYLSRLGLSEPPRYYQGWFTMFLDPDLQFYVGLKDGAPGNDEFLQYRAFLLNADPEEPIGLEEPELYGRGYVAADTPRLTIPHLDAAASMLRTAEKRLELQKRYGMADEQMLSFHERAQEWLADAREQLREQNPVGAVLSAGSSLAYAINNHPVIRERISHAVIGILWYLGLLVPFVFFAEKLLFGFPDIRKQIVASAVIFLVVFALLRAFHPAFQMVRSSLMILLGFVILLLTVLVTLMVGGKFKQNIKDLRSKEGRVEGADINRGGVVGTAFMLGLNNMRRRKVRTGLTCITLVLITFVMICFTSVSTDLVNVEYPTGRSSWNGIMVRNPNYLPLDAAEINNIRRIYGERYPITTWQWVTPQMSAWFADRMQNPEINVDREFELGGIKSSKRTRLNGCLVMHWNEPLFSGIDRFLLTNRGWFPRPPQTRKEKIAAAQEGYKEKRYVILPDTAARDLGLSVDDVNREPPTVMVRGDEYVVWGIIDAVELTKVLGLDGQSILPYDINSVQSLGTKVVGGNTVMIVPEEIGHLPGPQIMIVTKEPTAKPSLEQLATIACCILFPKEPYRILSDEPEQPAVDYREQRRLVLEYLERIGEPAYYAIDGISYYGSRQRAKTFAGLLELLVPILIAALTVFNTMRGSVYERKDEIYVYNAVGIAPNHVFFMFMAEALVYAVVGTMLGYILSQATGRVLTALNLTGGMNMDYSQIETIYASLTLMAAVMLSTILPARDAARMASPAETVSWKVPEAEGDVMRFNLPFTFTPHDRVAVVSYFHRWLDANGAGSSGPFYCAPPAPRLEYESKDGQRELVPGIVCTVWLKPYDLGVSQRLEISLPTDPETGEYIARITLVRLSGHLAAWNRTLKPFLGSLRKQFLNWRATTEADRHEMFTDAKRILSEIEIRETEHA